MLCLGTQRVETGSWSQCFRWRLQQAQQAVAGQKIQVVANTSDYSNACPVLAVEYSSSRITSTLRVALHRMTETPQKQNIKRHATLGYPVQK